MSDLEYMPIFCIGKLIDIGIAGDSSNAFW